MVAHATIHWSGTMPLMTLMASASQKVREGLSKVLVRRGIPAAGAWSRERQSSGQPTSCTAICFFICLLNTARVQSCDEIKAALDRLVDRHGDGILGEFAVIKLASGPIRWPISHQGWRSEGVEALPDQEGDGVSRKASSTASGAAPRKVSDELHGGEAIAAGNKGSTGARRDAKAPTPLRVLRHRDGECPQHQSTCCSDACRKKAARGGIEQQAESRWIVKCLRRMGLVAKIWPVYPWDNSPADLRLDGPPQAAFDELNLYGAVVTEG